MASTRQLRSSKRRLGTQHAQPSSSSATPTIEPHSANTSGLLSLADEIYLEILSHLPAFPIPNEHRGTDTELYGHRRLVLDALSQTCRTLRRVFLPYRWQRIEVYDRMDLGRGPLRGMGYKKSRATSVGKVYAVELIRQLEIVTVRNPSLAECVTVLDILVVDYSATTVLPELARCIGLLPNLHTVQIHFDVKVSQRSFDETQRRLIKESFAPYTYPNIRTACVSTDGTAFLRSCPGLKLLMPWKTEGYYLYEFEEIVTRCPSIETLGPLRIEPGMKLSSYILQIARLKNLRNVSFKLRRFPLDSDIQALWKITNLKIVKFVFEFQVEKHKIEEEKLRIEQMLCKTGALTKGEHKKMVVTIV
ncbi:hypothetical protein BJ912DRAFT_912141 [Pholiota molesta]|nr:hypothetical protein BJ912DRAFT_912141 [Pholiota molesta]